MVVKDQLGDQKILSLKIWDASRGKLQIHGNSGNPRLRWVSNVGGTPEQPACSSVPRGEPGSSGNRHNNPRRLLSVPRPLKRPFGKNRNAGQLFQATSVPAGGKACGGAHLLTVLMPTVQLSHSAGLSASHPQRGAERALTVFSFLGHELGEGCVGEGGGCWLWDG